LPDLLADSPITHGVDAEMFAALRQALDEDTTVLHRRVFIAILLSEVPMDAFARELGVSRNAVYKSLFAARRKLRASLRTSGCEPPYHVSVSR